MQTELSQMLSFDTYDPGITDKFGIRSKKEGTLPSTDENPPASIFLHEYLERKWLRTRTQFSFVPMHSFLR